MIGTNTALTLVDLAQPPSDKIGWPWTKQSHPVSERMPDGSLSNDSKVCQIQ